MDPLHSFPSRLVSSPNPELSSPAAGLPSVAARRIRRHLISAHHRDVLSRITSTALFLPHQIGTMPAISSTPTTSPPPNAPPPPRTSAAPRPASSLTASSRSSPSAAHDEELARSRWCVASRASLGLPRKQGRLGRGRAGPLRAGAQAARPPRHHKVDFSSIGRATNDCCPISSCLFIYSLT
jgi:hypothetical protein